MFNPSEWSKEVKEPLTPQKESYIYYMTRLLLGLSVPDWMIR